MPWYRAYPLNYAGHFVGGADFEAADDADAMRIVSHISNESDYEVWLGSRYLGRVSRNDKVILFPGRR